jgi:hypothetical protein
MQNKVIFPLTDKKAPAVPENTDWREYRGDAKTKMVGVMIPKGVIVFDLDTYKGVTTEQVDAAFGVELDWQCAELQKTRSGGTHYVFRVPVELDLTNGTNVCGVKHFDTRASFKGYIATGEGYENLTFADSVADALHDVEMWPALPEQAVAKLGSNTAPSESFDLLDAIAAQPLDIGFDEVVGFVRKLTPEQAESSDTWLKVMMAIYHQTQGSEEGWHLFDEFSQLSPSNYDKSKNRKRWESLSRSKKSNPVTFASVIDMVGGYAVVEADRVSGVMEKIKDASTKDEIEAVIAEIASCKLTELDSTLAVKMLIKQFNVVLGEKLSESHVKRMIRMSKPKHSAEFYDDYVFLTQIAEYMDKVTKITMGPRAFDVKHNRDTPTDMEGNPQNATNYVNNRIECVHSGMYAPMFDEFFTYEGVKYFNTYKPNTLRRKHWEGSKTVEMVKGHIAHLLPDESEQQLVINYLAHNIQHPGKKLQWAIILQGVQGDGKSFFAEMMGKLLGQSNCRTISVESLDEKFTAWAEGNCMVFIEELKLDNYRKYETLNKLKPYITNTTVSVRKMRTDAYEAVNTTNYFALTNFKDALPIDDNDRRYCVLFSQWQSKEALNNWKASNSNYYPKLYEAMRSGAGEILDWLASHTIPNEFLELTVAPETRAKATMVDMAKSSDYLLVEDALAEFECDDINHEVVNVTRLNHKISESVTFGSDYKDFPKTGRLANILLQMGYHNIGRYKDGERKNQQIYCRDDKRKALEFKPVPF